MDKKIGLIETLNIDAEMLDKHLCNRMLSDSVLSESDVSLAQTTASETGLSVARCISRLSLCGEDTLFSFVADIVGWQLVENVSQCPDAVAVTQTISQFDLNIDWCLENNVFAADIKGIIHVYTDWPLKPFEMSVVFDSIGKAETVRLHLLTPAMAAATADDIARERAVSALFGKQTSDLAALAEEAPVINLVNSVLERAVLAESSDVHIEAGANNMKVRFRVDGKLTEFMQQPVSRFAAIASRIKLLADLDIAERRLPQDGRFSVRANNRDFDVRVSTAPDVNGESIVMRLLPKQREELSLGNLGFEPDHLALIREWGSLSNGIVLVTGPTGSGKSTTLYGLLSDIKQGDEKILTVEDPVEYQLDGITQVQAKPDIGYTFAKALRTFLRQDPDIIMVGEIRDKETADIAIQSSLTGHLVLSTLHTNDACSVFPRLTDIGVEPYLVAATIQGVQAQRLLRKLCPHCSEPADPPDFLASETSGNWRKAVGCPECQGRGYKGRIGIYELIPVTPEMRNLITERKPVAELRKLARNIGTRSLLQDGLLKASKGITSVDEVLRVCSVDEDPS